MYATILLGCEGDGNAGVGSGGGVVAVTAYMGGTHGSGVLSSACDIGGKWVTGMGLGVTNSGGTWDMCFGCAGVGCVEGERVGGLGWGGVMSVCVVCLDSLWR